MPEQFDNMFFDAEPEEEQSFDIQKYVRGIWKRKWLVVLITVLFAGPWFFYVKQQVPIYEAETLLHFKDFDGKNETLLENRWMELTSRRFNEKVVQQLGLCLKLDEIPELEHQIKRYQVFQEFSTTDSPKPGNYSLDFNEFGKFVVRYYPKDLDRSVALDSGYVFEYTDAPFSLNGFSFTFLPDYESWPRHMPFTIQVFRYAVNGMKNRIEMRFRDSGSLMSLKMSDGDPVMAAKTVNELAAIYRKASIDIRDTDTDQKLKLLRQRLDIARSELDESSNALKRFESSHVMGLESEVGSQSQERDGLRTQINTLEQQKLGLVSMLERLDSELNASGRAYSGNLRLIFSSLIGMSTFANNSDIQILRTQLSELEQRRAEELRVVTEKYASVRAIDNKILGVYAQIRDAADRHLDGLELQIEQASTRISQIAQRLNRLPQQRQERLQLQRAVERDQENFDVLKQEAQNAEMNATVQTENIEIFQSADIPDFPINSDKKKKAAIGGIMGILLGLAVAFALEFLDKTFQTPEEIKRFLKLDVLGTIPEIDFSGTDEFRDDEKIKYIDQNLVTHDYSPTSIGEAYRALRTNLLFSKKTGKINTMVVTSIAPGDGKSFTSANVAISIAQQRHNTLLVDADLRRGVLHNTFGLGKEPGLTNYLSNSHTFSQVIKETYVPNLSMVTCGAMLPNPSELLGSGNMTRFLEQARRRFEVIIFDSPPLNAATDAVVLGIQVDGVVLVIRRGKTNWNVAKSKLEMFDKIDSRFLGAVFNGANTNLAHDGYSYYQY